VKHQRIVKLTSTTHTAVSGATAPGPPSLVMRDHHSPRGRWRTGCEVSAEMTRIVLHGPRLVVLWDTAEEAFRMVALDPELIQNLEEKPLTGSKPMLKVELEEMRNIMERLKTTIGEIMWNLERNIQNCSPKSLLIDWKKLRRMSTAFVPIVNMIQNLVTMEDPKIMEELREIIMGVPLEIVVLRGIMEVLEMEVAGEKEDPEIMEEAVGEPGTVNMTRILPMGKFQGRLERIILHFLSNNLRRKDLRVFSQLLQIKLSRTIPNRVWEEETETVEDIVMEEEEAVEEVVMEEVEETALDLWRTAWQHVHLR